jgi:uncharacterized protein DUF4037
MTRDLLPATAERLARWTEDPEVVGVIHVGSRSRGHGDALSDDDLEVVLTPAAYAGRAPEACVEGVATGEGAARRMIWDAQYLTLVDLEDKLPSPVDLDHWPYERAGVRFDRHGRVQPVVEALAAMPEGFRRARIRNGVVDGWVATRRLQKTLARGAPIGARLLAARAVRAIARVVFALEGRWVPLDHWFDAELATLTDDAGATPHLRAGLEGTDPGPFEAALNALAPAVEPWGVPSGIEGRRQLFLELVHPACAAERRVHGIN